MEVGVTSEAKKPMSAALAAKIQFQQKVNEMSTKNADGKNEYYTTSLKDNVYKTKEGKEVSEKVFSLRNHQKEEVQFALTYGGVLKHATYIDWSNGTPRKEFLAKDFMKLTQVAKDPGLVAMAMQMDWSMAKDKEAANVDVEEEQEAEIDLD